MGVRIEPLAAQHIPDLVAIHMRAFQEFFLTFLGAGFLKEFYRSFTEDEAGMAFVAVDEADGQVLGGIVGPLRPGGYFKRLLKRRWWAFCLASAGAVLRRPGVIGRLFRALLYRGDSPAGPERSLLSSIAVSPEAQGRGVGRALVAAWVDEARRRGSTGCFLTTDADHNEAVNGFYARLGWTLADSFTTPQGRRMNRYVLDFAPSAPPVAPPAAKPAAAARPEPGHE